MSIIREATEAADLNSILSALENPPIQFSSSVGTGPREFAGCVVALTESERSAVIEVLKSALKQPPAPLA